MEQQLSWSKAYIVSAVIHLVIFLLLAIGLAAVVAEKEQQTYEIDLQASDFSQGSGHAGGGGGSESLFPEPLKAEEVAKRVETVQQTMPTAHPVSEAVAPAQDAVSPPTQSSASTPSAASSTGTSTGGEPGSGSGSGGGNGSGAGTGSGDGTGDGQGVGDGSGAGQGSGNGNVSGTGSSPFDTNGFWAAVNAKKEYPYMAVKRGLEGTTQIVTTISSSGAITNVRISIPSGYSILDDAALSAAYAVGSYPNPTGKTVIVTTDVSFNLR